MPVGTMLVTPDLKYLCDCAMNTTTQGYNLHLLDTYSES